MSWYLTIAIGILIVIVLILLYFYSLKMYKKQKGKELSQQKQGSIKLQEQIDTFQTMIEENENLHSLEQEEALNKIMALQNEKGEKDIRKMLESNEFEAVVIATPDHWHAKAAIMANIPQNYRTKKVYSRSRQRQTATLVKYRSPKLCHSIE